MNLMTNPDMLEQITAIATILIAVAAFFITLWQIKSMHKHNRLSVMPILSYEIFYDKTDLGFGIYLCNKGIGPAIIKSMRIFIDNIEIKTQQKKIWPEAVQTLNINYPYVQMFTCGDDVSISAGERLPLLTINDNISKEIADEFKKALDRINIELLYESIYKQRFIKKLDDLE